MYSDYALPLPKLLPDLPHNALKIQHYWESYGMKSSINVPRTGTHLPFLWSLESNLKWEMQN